MYNPLGLLTLLRCGTQPAMRYVCSAVPVFAGHELDIICMYSSVWGRHAADVLCIAAMVCQLVRFIYC